MVFKNPSFTKKLIPTDRSHNKKKLMPRAVNRPFKWGINPTIMEDHAIHIEIHNKRAYTITKYNITLP